MILFYFSFLLWMNAKVLSILLLNFIDKHSDLIDLGSYENIS